MHQGRQHQRPHQRQPGRGDVGVIEQTRQPALRLTSRSHEPDHQAPQELPGALPTQPQLTQASHHNRHRARHHPERRSAARPRLRHIGLEPPESPKERKPIGQTCPSQVSTQGAETAEQHEPASQQKRPVPAVMPVGAFTTEAAQDQGRHKQQACQQH